MFLSCLQCPNLAYKLPGKEVLESMFSFKQKGSHFLKAARLMHKRNLQRYKGLRNLSLLLPSGRQSCTRTTVRVSGSGSNSYRSKNEEEDFF